jgi:hypothetical protein
LASNDIKVDAPRESLRAVSMKSLVGWATAIAASAAVLGVSAPTPTVDPTPLATPTVAPSEAAMMTRAIDAQLATYGFGKLCIDGPDTFPAVVSSDNEDEATRIRVKRLEYLGFIYVAKPTWSTDDGVTKTIYGPTAKGRPYFVTYRKIGWSGDYHGWCFADYRVARIVSSTGPHCPHPRADYGFERSSFLGVCTTDVTYAPRMIRIEDWTRSPQAKVFPEVSAVGAFAKATLSITLFQTSDGWEATTSQ